MCRAKLFLLPKMPTKATSPVSVNWVPPTKPPMITTGTSASIQAASRRSTGNVLTITTVTPMTNSHSTA